MDFLSAVSKQVLIFVVRMNTTTILLLLLFAFGASFVQRVTGFGFGIFIMTVLPHIMPSYGEATALSGMLAIVTVLVTAFRMRRYLCWKKLVVILLTFLVVSFFSVRMVSVIDDSSLRHVLGIILILVSIYFFFFGGRVRLKPNMAVQVSMGTVSGLMGGFFAMQGPPAVIYFLSCTDTKEEYIAMASWYFIIGNIMMTFFRAGNGFVTPAVGMAFCIALPAVAAGILVGKRVFNMMPVSTVRKCVYAYMAMAGVIALIS